MAKLNEILAGLLCLSITRKGPLCCGCSCFTDVENPEAEKARAQSSKHEATKARYDYKSQRSASKSEIKRIKAERKASKRSQKSGSEIQMVEKSQTQLSNPSTLAVQPSPSPIVSNEKSGTQEIGSPLSSAPAPQTSSPPLSDSNTLAASTPMSPAVEQMMTRRPTAKQRRADRKDSRDADRQERKDRGKKLKEERKARRSRSSRSSTG